MNKNGTPGSKIIALFDNTGYRSRSGTPLQIFETLEEAETKYAEQKAIIVEAMDSRLSELKKIRDDFIG